MKNENVLIKLSSSDSVDLKSVLSCAYYELQKAHFLSDDDVQRKHAEHYMTLIDDVTFQIAKQI